MQKISENCHAYNFAGEVDDYLYFDDDISEDTSQLKRLMKDGSMETGSKELDMEFVW